MKKLLFTILILLLSFSLTGCSQKEVLNEPVIYMYYSNANNDQITIENNDVIILGNLESIFIHFDVKWSYEIENIMSSPNLPKIELKKPELQYTIYLDGELIEDNLDASKPDEYEEQEFKVDTGIFVSTARISESITKNINLTVKGTYLVKVELNIKIDGLKKYYLAESKFILE